MTVELARHLVQSGVLPPAEVQAALLDAMVAGQPFVKVLIDGSPGTAKLVDRELARLGVPVLQSVRLARDLARELPPGMCTRLLGVPVGRDPETGYVNVAAADPLDTHIAEEFGFHLATPVCVFRAPLSEIEAALEAIPFTPSQPPPWRPVDEVYEDRTPAYGSERFRAPLIPRLDVVPGDRPQTGSLQGQSAQPPDRVAYASEPPIPLVRRSTGKADTDDLTPPVRPRFDTNPGLGLSPLAASLSSLGQDESGEPILGLFRSKPPSQLAVPPQPEADLIEEALEALPEVEDPNEVVDWLVYGAGAVSSLGVVFAAHKKSFDGRAGSQHLDARQIKALHIPRAGASIFDAAVHDGHYLGPVPATDVHAALRAFLGSAADEVYVSRLLVSDRPALMLLMARMTNADEASERIAPLVRKAGFAIERILLSRKL